MIAFSAGYLKEAARFAEAAELLIDVGYHEYSKREETNDEGRV